MKTMTNNKMKLSGAAMAASVAVIIAMAPLHANAGNAAPGEKPCYGVNACSGKSACKSGNHECKGMNKCKGMGVAPMRPEVCENILGGEVGRHIKAADDYKTDQ